MREDQNRVLLEATGTQIRQRGGWAPEQPYPPTWLVDNEGRTPMEGPSNG